MRSRSSSSRTLAGRFCSQDSNGSERSMSGPAAQGSEISGTRRQRSRTLVRTHLLTSSVHLLPTAGGSWGPRARVRLPALTSARARRSAARLSEHSLLIPNENVLYQRFSRNCWSSVSQTRPSPSAPSSRLSALLPFNACRRSATEVQAQNYVHFSRPMQLSSKSTPVRRQSHRHTREAEAGDLRPLVMRDHNKSSPYEQPLSVTGKPYGPSCSEGPSVPEPVAAAAVGPARPHLHVFLPTEAERDEVDSESVDEGFMEELDSKMTCLLLQKEPPAESPAA